jgi:hypothetical protein
VEVDQYTHWAWMVRDMRTDALRKWRDTYAPHIAITDLFANNVRRVRIVCEELPGGIWIITINVRGRRAHDTDMYFWKVRKLAGLYYIL